MMPVYEGGTCEYRCPWKPEGIRPSVNLMVWLQGINLRSSGRTLHTLSCRAILPGPSYTHSIDLAYFDIEFISAWMISMKILNV